MTTLINTLKSATAYGTIGTRNRKMPGTAYALPPSKCIVGAKLALIPDSICNGCYAADTERRWSSARKGWGANFDKAAEWIARDPETWAGAIAFQIRWHLKRLGEDCHRWFDAGDLQSVEMLRAIVLVCEQTPGIKHWLPTREAKIVADWRAAGGTEPANLVIRISSTMVGDKPRNAPHTSTVHREGEQAHGHACPAYSAEHRALNDGDMFCGPCRACWSRDVANVSYPFH
jgi:hypothetical protein